MRVGLGALARDSIPRGSNPEPRRVQLNFYSSGLTGGHFGAFLAVFLAVVAFFLVVLAVFLVVLVFGAAFASGTAGVSAGAIEGAAAAGGPAGLDGAAGMGAGVFSWARAAPWRLSRKTPALANVISYFMFPHLLKKDLK